MSNITEKFLKSIKAIHIVAETKNYSLILAPDKLDCHLSYQVYNKKYLVKEAESSMLPSALKYLGDLEAHLQAALDIHEEEVGETV